MRYILSATLILLCGFLLLSAPDGHAKKKSDLVEDYDSYQVQTIGVMVWQMRKNDDDARNIMSRELARVLDPIKYYWKSDRGLRSLARSAGADSLLNVLEEQWRSGVKMDPATLMAFGERVSVDALLASFIDVWERDIIEHYERGSSITEIGVIHALYSTKTGEQLWRTQIDKEGEGPYNEPGRESTVGVSKTGIQTQVRSSTPLDPPEFEEVAEQVGDELKKRFPPPPKIEKKEPPAEKEAAEETSEESAKETTSDDSK
jgi:hypothetical protein